MAILSTIFSSIGMSIVDKFLDKGLAAFKLYNEKQISMEEFRNRLYLAMQDSFKAVEISHADNIAKTFTAFYSFAQTSTLAISVWAFVTISQTFVLLWHQWAIPFIVYMGWTKSYPSSGTTTEWAYLLVAACVGGGLVLLRSGPGSGSVTDRIKSLAGK